MTIAILVARSLVAAVLIASGAAKLADLRGFQGTLVGLGLRRGVEPAAAILAAVEVLLGAASLSSAWPVVTDAGILVLTLAFVAVAGIAARRRPGLRCRCFGALDNSRFGATALARSVALAAVAAAVFAAQLAHDTTADWSRFTAAVLLVSAGAFALACVQAARAIGLVQEGETA